uniref:ATP synthase F(0) complex subunit 8 n=3 Tax=Oryctolagus cuniculus TaxID=9986 RepID=ATP8_RABIT|nr:ATP synthase F0 subunit 8 [Oryctolagus cuniculus]O79431.1 RecName: Full=ATP synthase protein 8; AltName: Full=A6L; AltName: Full=Chargerin II; AltName: Full=F-ATPase subunit 8 [Oryctolagus cuniculus]AZM31678.1 ATP synthase F0 subunit 8 [Oryctolagus cuniculus]QJW33606.1 ATP synthase F0 subunit 8 [Oryctolagus cuniculus]QNO34263.1 ATP synthase F0 subunit 8 [Oryctolagus cuniculus]QSQ71402.1 ATP synthase F0 subunit 8 [Oryctolagus cuniculus]CAA04851.1 ATPase subunit 8 [Oryctolagus cuniculus]
MPQLDTSTWFTTIVAMILSLFILMQLKFHKYTYPMNPVLKALESTSFPCPWETKWTKIYSPLSLPQH